MAFSPSMRRLLHLRESLERQQELRVAQAAAHLQRARAELGHSQASRRRVLGHQAGELAAGASGAELAATDLQRQTELARAQRLQLEVERLRAAHAAACSRLAERTRDRKTLDTLAQESRAHELREAARRLQSAQDENFLRRKNAASNKQ
ncbi:MAG: flagellar FliJ family protein [Terriglobales bacterium]